MRLPRLIALTALAACLAATASAQSIELSLQSGDLVPTVGEVRFIQKVRVTGRGAVITEVTLVNATAGVGILANGFPLLIAGTPILDPGGEVGAWLDISMNDANFVWILDLTGNPGGAAMDTGVWWNAFNLALEGKVVDSPDVSAGTNYKRFWSAKVNDNESVIVNCDIDDPGIAGTTEAALIRIDTDGMGGVVATNVLIMEGDPIPGQAETFLDTPGGVTAAALNRRNDWISTITDSGPNLANTMVMINGEKVFKETEVAPVEGRVWADLGNQACDINDLGEWVSRATLDPPPAGPNDRTLIVKNGEIFVQQGDTFAAISPHQVDRFGSSPVFISNAGDVYWYTSFTNSNANQDTAFFRNHEAIIREGITSVGGNAVTAVIASAYGFGISQSGRFFAAEVKLQGTGESVILMDFGAVIRQPGCAGNPGTIVKTSGEALTGQTLSFEMDGGQSLGALNELHFSLGATLPNSECGINTAFGELMINLSAAKKLGKVVGPPYAGSPITYQVPIPADPALVDLKIYAQGVFVDLTQPQGSRVTLTNGMSIEIGSP